ncbi:glycosyl transferase [Cryobacterium tepidiphilum]|uniref:Glycosyl transferase n=2 Tax=Cryobacterium tepidiphilum TaxID=2486026 RepID=A0A3M8L0P7_9MICO|nr:glycosyl transferase [Cryobacterium tepidiphilum]
MTQPGALDADPQDEESSGPAPVRRGSFIARVLTARGDELVADLLAVVGLGIAFSGAPAWLPLVFGALALALGLAVARRRPDAAGTFVVSRILVVFLAVAVMGAEGEGRWIPAVLLALLITGEATCASVSRGAIPFAAHLPGVEPRNAGWFPVDYLYFINLAASVAFIVLGLAGFPAWGLVILVLVAAVPSAISFLDGILRIRARRGAESNLTRTLRAYEPVFAVHWDAPEGTDYQLAMWLPFLERLGEKFFVIVRNEESFPDVVRLTTAPVLLRKELADMDAVVVPTLRAAFYVNNAVRNSHFVRYPQLKHVQLNHGDSDKAPSYNPVFRMFDKDFVAGQAAIDRFAAHGVDAPPQLFEIVGRPQVADVEVAASAGKVQAVKTVLYAPTWAGFHIDSAYSSLPIGVAIVEALIARGCDVVYRPHPYTGRTKGLEAESARIKELLAKDAEASGRNHVLGERAEQAMSLVDCFNASDALISDVSSVVPDFLYSEKPFAVCAMLGSLDAFVEGFPIARGGYTIAADGSNLDAVLDDLLGDDPLRPARHSLKTYFLGDIPPERYVDVFLDAARRMLRQPPVI